MTAAEARALRLLACPSCFTGNRVPEDRLGDAPKCGQCGTALLEGKPIALDESNFDAFAARSDLPVLVDFWAPWCGPCRTMAPAFEQAASEFATRVRLAKVNTDTSQALASRFGIRSIPTLVLLRGAKEAGRVSGALDARRLRLWIEGQL